MSGPVTPRDEGRHAAPPAAGSSWMECLGLEVVGLTGGGPAGGERRAVTVTSRVVLHPGRAGGRTELAVVVREAGRSPVVLNEDGLDLPAARWEFRGPGVWIDHVVEEPMRRWSYGLEAFALEVDDLGDFEAKQVGIRVPLGWELDVEAIGPPEPLAPEEQGGGSSWSGYRQAGEVDGILLGGAGGAAERIIGGRARRWHWWGTGGPERPGS